MSKTPQPSIQAFTDPKEQMWARHVYTRLDSLEEVTNLQSFSNGRKSPAPPQAGLVVTTNSKVPGVFNVRITNPEFLGQGRNPIAAPMRHQVRACPYSNFSKQVTSFPISHQTYYPISELGPGTFHFELTSTFDGQTFNRPVYQKASA